MSDDYRAVMIGASAGGIEAICAVLSRLGPDCQVPIVVVLHVPTTRESRLLEVLQSRSRLPVCEVEDKQPLARGHVYLAPPDYHVLVEDEQSLALSNDLPVHYCRPSIDVLFETAAEVFEHRVIGVILTGANRDGADGLAKIIDAGGLGVVQDPGNAHSPAMPKAAINASASALVMDLLDIPDFLNERI